MTSLSHTSSLNELQPNTEQQPVQLARRSRAITGILPQSQGAYVRRCLRTMHYEELDVAPTEQPDTLTMTPSDTHPLFGIGRRLIFQEDMKASSPPRQFLCCRLTLQPNA